MLRRTIFHGDRLRCSGRRLPGPSSPPSPPRPPRRGGGPEGGPPAVTRRSPEVGPFGRPLRAVRSTPGRFSRPVRSTPGRSVAGRGAVTGREADAARPAAPASGRRLRSATASLSEPGRPGCGSFCVACGLGAPCGGRPSGGRPWGGRPWGGRPCGGGPCRGGCGPRGPPCRGCGCRWPGGGSGRKPGGGPWRRSGEFGPGCEPRCGRPPCGSSP